MSSSLSKASGAQFVAIIARRDGSHFVECFLRGSPPAPGFPSEMEPIFNNSDLPSFPAMSLQQARETAIDQARPHGYTEADIVWETE